MKVRVKTKIKRFFKHIIKTLYLPDMLLLPGQLAYFLVLSVIPTITLITYLASKLNLSIDVLHSFLQTAFSKEMADLMLSTSSVPNAGLRLTIVIIICYYICSNGTNSIILSSNKIYGITNSSYLKRRIKAIFMSIIFVLIIVFMMIVSIYGVKIVGLIKYVNMNDSVTETIIRVFNYLKSPLMWLLLFVIIKIIYTIAPDKKIKTNKTNMGALFTTVTWIITTRLYAYYINNIANYSAFYGGLTSICVLMIWFYFLAFLFVVGMSINFQRENEELEKTSNIKISRK